jgi:hypothetical protein
MEPIRHEACLNPLCKDIGKLDAGNISLHASCDTKSGTRQRHLCKNCGGTFSANTGTAYVGLRCSRDAFDQVATMRIEGNSSEHGATVQRDGASRQDCRPSPRGERWLRVLRKGGPQGARGRCDLGPGDQDAAQQHRWKLSSRREQHPRMQAPPAMPSPSAMSRGRKHSAAPVRRSSVTVSSPVRFASTLPGRSGRDWGTIAGRSGRGRRSAEGSAPRINRARRGSGASPHVPLISRAWGDRGAVCNASQRVTATATSRPKRSSPRARFRRSGTVVEA